MKILSVESSGQVASVGVSENENILYEIYSNIGLTHSKMLVPLIDHVLKACSLKTVDIDLFAVGIGPGSFTGIRIGVSAVKAMAYVYEKPCAGVSSLEALAWNHVGIQGRLCTTVDFVGGQLYYAFFQSDGHKIERLSQDAAATPEQLCQEIKKCNQNIIFIGNSSELCYNICLNEGVQARLGPTWLQYGHASGIAQAACHMHSSGRTVASVQLIPNYIRIPQAERERQKREGG